LNWVRQGFVAGLILLMLVMFVILLATSTPLERRVEQRLTVLFETSPSDIGVVTLYQACGKTAWCWLTLSFLGLALVTELVVTIVAGCLGMLQPASLKVPAFVVLPSLGLFAGAAVVQWLTWDNSLRAVETRIAQIRQEEKEKQDRDEAERQAEMNRTREEERKRQAALEAERTRQELREKEFQRRQRELQLEKEKQEFEEKKRREKEARLKREQEEKEAAERERQRLAALEAERKRKAEQHRRDLKSPDPIIRIRALKVVATSDQPTAAIPGLIELLTRKEVRHEAAVVLAQIGPDAVPPLIKALGNDDLYVRYEAALALGRIRAKEAVPTLKRLRENDPSPLVRRTAKKAIESIEE
jgi:hypothetical protein